MSQLIAGVLIEKAQSLTLEEFCSAMHTQPHIVIEMIQFQLIQPQGKTPAEWRFDSISLKRGKIAISFYRDLEINMAGIALALELLDKIEDLQNQVNILEKTSDT